MFSSVMNRFNERRAAGLEGEAADSGFTLIELMVVLLILAILLAIAIPTFLGVTKSANDRAAQSNLNTSLIDAKTVLNSTSNQTYPSVATLLTQLQSNEPTLSSSLTSTTVALTAGQIGVYTSVNNDGVVFISLAQKTQECWILADNTGAITDATAGNPYLAGGVPTTAGEQYGVYKTTATNTCSFAKVAAATPTFSSSQFPPAP